MDFNLYFEECRKSVYKMETDEVLLSKIGSSEQETDLSVPPNCDGYGRIRHFKRFIAEDWGTDPLPIDPAIKALNLPYTDLVKAQVFQIATCNLKCWYCFVPDSLKCGNRKNSNWFTAYEMVELFKRSEYKAKVIDLSGGNPELVPEWVVNTMKALEKNKLQDEIYLWSDDTLTIDYTFKYLNSDDLLFMRSYHNYGKVCCFKGFDAHSFAFNTKLSEDFYDRQFEIFTKYLELGLDIYGYVTFTTDDINDIEGKMHKFISKLRQCHPLLPLRIVPLKIGIFSPTRSRMNPIYERALYNQIIVFNEWKKQLHSLYYTELLVRNICDIQLY